MTLHPETEIVASGHDPIARVHTYTVERAGRRWTFNIADADFEQFGAVQGASAVQNREARRAHLARCVTAAMGGPADGA